MRKKDHVKICDKLRKTKFRWTYLQQKFIIYLHQNALKVQ